MKPRPYKMDLCPSCKIREKMVKSKLCKPCNNLLHPTTLTHGGWVGGQRSGTFVSWQNMMARCFNPNEPAYKHYGAKGITVCERWRKFGNFLADMGERPARMTIDRFPNQRGNYEPGNCRWATWTEQENNRKDNIKVEINGEILSVSQWAVKLSINRGTLYQRYHRGTWP